MHSGQGGQQIFYAGLSLMVTGLYIIFRWSAGPFKTKTTRMIGIACLIFGFGLFVIGICSTFAK